MVMQIPLLFTFLLGLCFRAHHHHPHPPTSYSPSSFNRSSFPADFLFGLASSAYQFEGATTEGGRGPSVWDTYFQKHPDKLPALGLAKVAADQYHRYKEDVEIMKSMGLDTYRLSISWPRILPKGKLNGGVNPEGIKYYNDLFNELTANGIKPFVTLFHWDLPQALEDEYGGFLSPKIVDDFRDYAKVCFENFGDRVKHWLTLNEPEIYARFGYSLGKFPPGRCSAWLKRNCSNGDSTTEPYIVGHNQILAHAAAVELYRKLYKPTQKGEIGITVTTEWYIPLSNTKQDQDATVRKEEFHTGWMMNPLTYGDYPQIMKSLVGKRLPKFSKKQSKLVARSIDFIGVNYYTSYYTSNMQKKKNATVIPSFETDHHVLISSKRNGVPLSIEKSGSEWINDYPKGIRNQLVYLTKIYNSPKMYITENGMDEYDNPTLSLKEALNDTSRIKYHHDHLLQLAKAVKDDGVHVKGYIGWSFMDNFGWDSGYSLRSGFVFVDFKNGMKRYPKLSAQWFKEFLKKQEL